MIEIEIVPIKIVEVLLMTLNMKRGETAVEEGDVIATVIVTATHRPIASTVVVAAVIEIGLDLVHVISMIVVRIVIAMEGDIVLGPDLLILDVAIETLVLHDTPVEAMIVEITKASQMLQRCRSLVWHSNLFHPMG